MSVNLSLRKPFNPYRLVFFDYRNEMSGSLAAHFIERASLNTRPTTLLICRKKSDLNIPI